MVVNRVKLVFSLAMMLLFIMNAFAKKEKVDYEALINKLNAKELDELLIKDKKAATVKLGYRGETMLLFAIRNGKGIDIVNSLVAKIKATTPNAKKQDGLIYISIYTLDDEKVAALILNQYPITKKAVLTKALKRRDKAKSCAFEYIKNNDNCCVYDLLIGKVDQKTLEKYKPDSYDAWKAARMAPEPAAPATEPPKEESVPESPPIAPTPEAAPEATMFLYDYAPKVTDEAEKKDEIPIGDPNKKDTMGVTLLMKAARAGNDWEVKKLLEAGALVNAQDYEGWTAIMYAARYQNSEAVVNTLIQNGADLTLSNRYGTSVLLIAAVYSANPLIMKAILDNIVTGSNDVFKAFIMALTSNEQSATSQVAKLQVFIDRNISINRFYEGKTPLMYGALYASDTSVLKLLLDNGAIKTLRDTTGKTAYDWAKMNTQLAHDDIYWSLNSR